MTPWLDLSQADGKRFGLRIARHPLDAPTPGAGDIRAAIGELDPDVTILRLPAEDQETQASLGASGMPLIHADTLVYYHRDLSVPASPDSTMGPGKVAMASTSDAGTIRELASAGFHGYRSHYNANPLFPLDRVLEGYVEWAVSHLLARRPGDDTWIVRLDGDPMGFATIRHDRDKADFEVLLNAVHPDAQGRGLYRRLLGEMVAHYSGHGCRTARISTQVWNYRVQRAWSALDFKLVRAYNTYHINRRGSAETAAPNDAGRAGAARDGHTR